MTQSQLASDQATPVRVHRDGSYDAVVIGAGFSGLMAAARLARAGARVLVCEQADSVGGLFSSFTRGGYLFDGGIRAVESSGVIMPALAELGVLERIQFQPSPVAFVTNGVVQPIRDFADVASHFSLLETLFPSQRAGLQHVLSDTRIVFDMLDGMLQFPIPFFELPGGGKEARSEWFKAHGSALKHFPAAGAMMKRELRPYLERHLSDPQLVNLLSDLFPEGTSVFFGLGYFRMFLDYHYPTGGIRRIPEEIAAAVRAWDGEIRTNCRVERVLLRAGRACGVRLTTGEEIAADYVIAASDLRQALTTLAPDAVLPTRFAEKLRRAEVSHSVFSVFLGIDMPAEELGFEGCPHVFYSPDLEGITESDRRTRLDYFAHVPQEISVPCLHQPDLAPPGKTGLSIGVMTNWDWDGGWVRDPAEYAALKERCARDLIGSLERFVPGLSERIELCITATPRTLEARTSNSRGAIMGWSYHRERALPRGNFLQMRSAVRTPVPHLLVAGHWALSPGGGPVAALTGILAAEHVLKG
jgi:all-trans-retinol 13,14-reductase